MRITRSSQEHQKIHERHERTDAAIQAAVKSYAEMQDTHAKVKKVSTRVENLRKSFERADKRLGHR